MEARGDALRTDRTHFAGLDGLRGLAALAVVIYHYSVRYDTYLHHDPLPHIWLPTGWAGVYLFFILSGFVISSSLERRHDALDFAISRMARLYPTYWIAVVLTFTVLWFWPLPKDQVSLRDALINLTMMQGFIGVPHVDGAYWTLRPELSFYAVCVILLLIGRGAWVGRALGLLVAFALWDAVALRMEWHRVPGIVRKFAGLQYIAWFALGNVLWQLRNRRSLCGSAVGFLGILLTIGLTMGPTSAAAALGAAAALLLVTLPSVPYLGWAPLVWLGRISYPLYLIHQNVGFVLIRLGYRLGLAPDAAIVITILIVSAIAFGISTCVEYPTMRVVRQWLRARENKKDSIGVIAPIEPGS